MRVRLLDIADDDWPLIRRWLEADHVRPFWGEPEENLGENRDCPYFHYFQ